MSESEWEWEEADEERVEVWKEGEPSRTELMDELGVWEMKLVDLLRALFPLAVIAPIPDVALIIPVVVCPFDSPEGP